MSDRYAEWSRRLRDSDRKAFAEVFEAAHEPLLRYAWRLTGYEPSARDLVQDAFLKLWNVRASLDPARSLKALLYTMVRNMAYNEHKARKRHEGLLAEVDHPLQNDHLPDDEALDASMLGRQIQAWIREMPSRRREAFVLSRFQGLSHEEIAAVMDLSPPTVNTHIVLALKYLRERLRALETNSATS